jgi:COMPASS component SWD3
MSMSPNGNILVVSNLDTGFDIYHLDNSNLDGSVIHPGNGRLIPVTFVYDGHSILSGSQSGQVQLWDPLLRKNLQILQHEGNVTILCSRSWFKC